MEGRTDAARTRKSIVFLTSLALASFATTAGFKLWMANAQGFPSFDSGSNGSDGALDLSDRDPGTVVELGPSADGDNIYHFTSVDIPTEVTVRLSARSLGTSPVFWLASGAVFIAGTIDLDGEVGHPSGGRTSNALGGAGGFPGGVVLQNGFGPGGGTVSSSTFDQRGKHVGVYGNAFLQPLIGGSGGAGGLRSNEAGGGAGGGAILIASSETISLDGTVSAVGGAAGSFSDDVGGGSGGAVRLLAPEMSGSGTITTFGGRGRTFAESGRVRLEAYQQSFSGTITAGTSRSVTLTPTTSILPAAAAPSLRVVRVAGADVPPNPIGGFAMPDVTIDEGASVPVEIEARNVPIGTTVEVTIANETNSLVTVQSSPLTGTLELSMATAQVTFPNGFTRILVQTVIPAE